MAQGIEVPLKTKDGRLKKLSGDDYIDQIVRIAMGSGDSENPFQDIALSGDRFIFAINDGMTEGEIRTRVLAIFDSLQRDQLAKLRPKDISFSREEEGELKMNISYKNIETQERKEIEVPIPPEGE